MNTTSNDGLNSSPVSTDPLVAAIAAYRKACEAFEALDCAEVDNPTSVEKTYGPPLSVLQVWNKPAKTKNGAIAALRLAHDELYTDHTEGYAPLRMVRAALGFLEKSEAGGVTRTPDHIAFEFLDHRDELNDILWYIKVAVDKSHAIQHGINENPDYTPDDADLDLIDSVLRLVWRRVSEVSSTLDAFRDEVMKARQAA